LKEPKLKPLCTQVTAKPDTKSIIVFNKGKAVTFIIWTPLGGHNDASSTEGHKEECKKAQKNPKKSIISEITNKINPFFKPDLTTNVWNPKYVDSVTISLNQ